MVLVPQSTFSEQQIGPEVDARGGGRGIDARGGGRGVEARGVGRGVEARGRRARF